MASITLADTAVAGSNARVVHGIAGTTILQGQVVYYDSAARNYKLAQANSANTDEVTGIALNGGKTGAPLTVMISGTLAGVTGLTVGQLYVLSDSVAGAIMDVGDLTSSDYVSFVGIGITTTSLSVNPLNSSVQVPA